MNVFKMGIIACAMSLLGCADPSGPLPPNLPPSKVFTAISLNVDAVIVAVGDSLDLFPTAFSITGDTLPIEGNALEWGVSDGSILTVDQNGRVHMIKESGGDIVTSWVRWTSNGATRSDSAYILVTQTREPVARLQIRPQGDSVRISGDCCGVSIIAKSATGDSLGIIRAPLVGDPALKLSELLILYWGPWGVSIGLSQYTVAGDRLGPFWLRTEALVYGTLLSDSIQMIGLYPPKSTVEFKTDPISTEITSVSDGHTRFIQPCGTIQFWNRTSDTLEIVFDDPTKVSGCNPGDPTGDIPSLARNAMIERKVPSGTVGWSARIKGSPPSSKTVTGTVTTKEP